MSAKKIPDRWLEYIPVGSKVSGTKFIAFKTPLSKDICSQMKPSERFTPQTVMERCPNLRMIIDLTNTTRYYNKQEFIDRGVQYEKIMCPGQILPPQALIYRFFELIDEFYLQNGLKDVLIGIHCTHGVNRTAYFIGRYMVQRMGFHFEKAIPCIEEARGHKIERQNYITDLMNQTPIPSSVSTGKKGFDSRNNKTRREDVKVMLKPQNKLMTTKVFQKTIIKETGGRRKQPVAIPKPRSRSPIRKKIVDPYLRKNHDLPRRKEYPVEDRRQAEIDRRTVEEARRVTEQERWPMEDRRGPNLYEKRPIDIMDSKRSFNAGKKGFEVDRRAEYDSRPQEFDRRIMEHDRRPIDLDRGPMELDRRAMELDRRPVEPERRFSDLDRRPQEFDRRVLEGNRREINLDRRGIDFEQGSLNQDRRGIGHDRRAMEHSRVVMEQDRRGMEQDRRGMEQDGRGMEQNRRMELDRSPRRHEYDRRLLDDRRERRARSRSPSVERWGRKESVMLTEPKREEYPRAMPAGFVSTQPPPWPEQRQLSQAPPVWEQQQPSRSIPHQSRFDQQYPPQNFPEVKLYQPTFQHPPQPQPQPQFFSPTQALPDSYQPQRPLETTRFRSPSPRIYRKEERRPRSRSPRGRSPSGRSLAVGRPQARQRSPPRSDHFVKKVHGDAVYWEPRKPSPQFIAPLMAHQPPRFEFIDNAPKLKRKPSPQRSPPRKRRSPSPKQWQAQERRDRPNWSQWDMSTHMAPPVQDQVYRDDCRELLNQKRSQDASFPPEGSGGLTISGIPKQVDLRSIIGGEIRTQEGVSKFSKMGGGSSHHLKNPNPRLRSPRSRKY